MKDDFFQKIHGNMIFSVYMYICYKHDITFLPKKAKITFSRKNTLKGGISGITKKSNIYPRKFLLKYLIDWHSRLTLHKEFQSFSVLLWRPYRHFYIFLSSDKKQESQCIELKFDLFFNLCGWRYSTVKSLQYLVSFSPQELYLEECLSLN